MFIPIKGYWLIITIQRSYENYIIMVFHPNTFQAPEYSIFLCFMLLWHKTKMCYEYFQCLINNINNNTPPAYTENAIFSPWQPFWASLSQQTSNRLLIKTYLKYQKDQRQSSPALIKYLIRFQLISVTECRSMNHTLLWLGGDPLSKFGVWPLSILDHFMILDVPTYIKIFFGA